MKSADRGMLTLVQLKELVATGQVDTVMVAFTDHYGRLHGKRYDAEYFVEEIHEQGTPCPGSQSVGARMWLVVGSENRRTQRQSDAEHAKVNQ